MSYIRKYFKKRYLIIHDYLADHKALAKFLSHGGLHLATLVLLLALMFVMLWQLNKLSESQTNTFVFHIGCNNSKLKLQDFQADFDFYDNKAEVNLLTSYRPSRQYTQEQLDFFYAEGDRRGVFSPFISFQHRPKANIKKWIFSDSVFVFDEGSYAACSNPYSYSNYPYHYDKSYRVDSVGLSRLHYLKKENNLLQVFGNRRQTTNTDYIKLSLIFDKYKYRENPYHNINIRFRTGCNLKLSPDTSYTSFGSNYLKINFRSVVAPWVDENMNHVYAFKTIQPTPSKIGLESIEYNDIETINEILKSGIYIAAEDVEKARNANKLSFLYSVLLGTIIAFMLDILIQLILKWRKLSK